MIKADASAERRELRPIARACGSRVNWSYAPIMSDERQLPSPDPAFRWSHESWGLALRCARLEPVAQHLFTTRQLELRDPVRLAESWAQAAEAVGATIDDLKRVKQVHGRTVHVVNREDAHSTVTPEADALVSNIPGIALAVKVADCVPVLIADPRTGAAAAVHAGWRGSAAGVPAAAVETLTREYHTRPRDLVAAVGPCIGPCCYEVGQDVVDAFAATGASGQQLTRWFVRTEGQLRLDLWTVTSDRLIDAGLLPDHIHLCGLCTKTHAWIFDSYRAHGVAAGRMAAIIRVPRR